MNLPEAAPGEGARPEVDHFSNWSIAGGEKHPAYLAGRAYWCIAHPSDRGTKPCLHWMTKSALPCRFCALNKMPTLLGYVPVWRAVDYRPLIVIVYEPEREHVDKLLLHDRVMIGREKEKGAALWVRKCLEQEPRFQTALTRRMCAQHVTRSCLVLWKMPELVAWMQNQKCCDNALSLDTEANPAPTPGAPTEPRTDAGQRYEGPSRIAGEGAIDGALARAMQKAKERESLRNGKHD